MTLRASIIVAALIVLEGPVAAQGSSLPTLRGDLVSELIDPVVPISGEGLLGLVLKGRGDGVDPDHLYVYLPRAPRSGQIMFSLSLPDGRYLASWQTSVTPGLTGWARVEYPGTARARLAKLNVDELAVLASDGEVSFLVRWTVPELTDQMILMINAERAQAFAVERYGDRRRRVDCDPVAGRQSLRFDRVCRLSRVQVESDAGILEIRRRKNGQHFTSLYITVVQ